MAELVQQICDSTPALSGSVGSIPRTLTRKTLPVNDDGTLQQQATPASNLILAEHARIAQTKMKPSKSYTHGLSSSAGTVHIPTSTSAQGSLSLLADISPNHSHFFEVMYVGKIRVSHKRVPNTFIDDALPKFQAYDARRLSLLQEAMPNGKTTKTTKTTNIAEEEDHHTQNDIKHANDDAKDETDEQSTESNGETELEFDVNESNSSSNQTGAINDVKLVITLDDKENKTPPPLLRGKSQNDISSSTQLNHENVDVDVDVDVDEQQQFVEKPKINIVVNNCLATEELTENIKSSNAAENIPKQRDRSVSHGCLPPYVEQNRTMVFLVGRADVRLISPDRKQVLLYKNFRDIASCAQGQQHADHFSIICRESNSDSYIGYVFKCQSEHVCDDITSAISQAFETCADLKNTKTAQVFSCDHCPMLWYHKLCADVEGLNSKKTQNLIFRRIESLSEEEQETVWAKFYGSEKMSCPLQDQNQFLMTLLRAHCESRQQRHIHDTAENRSEFLNQYLGGSTIFMKAKRSLTNSFDHLLKRKPSKDEFGLAKDLREIKESLVEPAGANKGVEATPTTTAAETLYTRSSSVGSSQNITDADHLKSPMMDIFMKVGNSPKDTETHPGSWRQAILNSVVTPSKGMEHENQSEFMSPRRAASTVQGKRTREELCELWRTAIRQTVLLNRMEKENAMLTARQNENELKRMKLDYDDIVTIDKQLVERWEVIIGDTMQIGNKKDPKVLAQAVRTGVPRSKRGDVWSFLAEQHSMNIAPVDVKKFPNFNTPYDVLLKNLTEHQHAIFIDLGRTFPNHKFYKDPLGLGQLSLFNLLKAYSILDPELGYCQGLGFICGVLLLHCNENDAFQLLKHLMFQRKMRTKYLPDMKKFQLQLYQLSRLVKDQLPDLYIWLDQNDVSPTLYAAPWILTVFSSQFPLGFVARVFDMIFLESPEVIFKFAIALLSVHKEQLLACDNFEEIMDYLKNVVPKVDNTIMEKILKLVFTIDVTKNLSEYNVEYNVLQEEISTTNHHLDMLNREKLKREHLEQQLQFAQSSITQLETTRSSQQSQISTLQAQVQSMELTIQMLGRYVNRLTEQSPDLEVPADLRRMLQQLNQIERQHRKPYFAERKMSKSLSVNSHLGFPLRVLEELNEREDQHGSTAAQQKSHTEKPSYFEHTFEQLRQQRLHGSFSNITVSPNEQLSAEKQQKRPNQLLDNATSATKLNDSKFPENVDKLVLNIRSPTEVDSGVSTPLSPPSSASSSLVGTVAGNGTGSGGIFSRIGYKNTPAGLAKQFTAETSNNNNNMQLTKVIIKSEATNGSEQPMHPLGNIGEVNVRFNGITPLKSLSSFNYTRNNTIGRKEQAAHSANNISRPANS